MRLIVILTVLLAFAFSAKAQDSTTAKKDSTIAMRRTLQPNEGVVRFLVDVDNGYFEVLINDTILLKRYIDTLVAGNYTASIWSPGYNTISLSYVVEPGKITTENVVMAPNSTKKEFELAYKEYRKAFHRTLTLPACLTLANTLIAGSFMMVAYDIKIKIQQDIELYNKATTANEVNDIKLRVSENNLKYNVYRTIFYTGSAVSIAMLGTTFYTAIRFKKRNEEPEYFDKSPWHDRFSLGITPYGCKIKFNFG